MRVLKRITTPFAAILLAVCLCASMSGCSLFKKNSGDILPHLISEDDAEASPVRPVDSLADTSGFLSDTKEEQYDELIEILYNNCRPDFTDAFDEVKSIYDSAVQVLNRYIRNDFSEFERVHAIHDYLAYYIEYDFDLLDNADAADGSEAAFGLEGVFLNKKAVCDGFTKAFRLFCGIEQIRCIRVTGQYNMDGVAINHSWNKVRVSGIWYNVDATMDSWHVYTGSDERTDIMNHGYFLISDEAIREPLTGRHTQIIHEYDYDDGEQISPDIVNYECNRNYEFHRATSLGLGSYSMEITSQEELNDVFALIKKSKRKVGKVELKLSFDGYDKSNLNRADAYLTQITEAYNKAKPYDFAFDTANGVYPYQRYPNGVFVFLIYK